MLLVAFLLGFVFSAGAFEASPRPGLTTEFFPERDKDYRGTGGPIRLRGAKSLEGTRRVVLTFDDGPSTETTPLVLDTLAAYGVKATFFVVTGKLDSRTLPIAERIVREGHVLASHDVRHRDNKRESEKLFKREIGASLDAVQSIIQAVRPGDDSPLYYRFPYGSYGDSKGYHHLNAIREISRANYGEDCVNVVFWNMDMVDFLSEMTPEDVARNFMAQFDGGTGYQLGRGVNPDGTSRFVKVPTRIKNPPQGGVVLFHDVQPRTAAALPLILEYARTHGIEIAHLPEVDEFQPGTRRCVRR